MQKKSFYTQAVYQDCLERIGHLTPQTQPQWGRMDVAQMLAHCAEVQEVINGKPFDKNPLFVRLFKGFIRKAVLSEKPFSRGLQTHPQYKITTSHDFEREKKRLLEALKAFKQTGPEAARKIKHPLFGEMTPEEKGWSVYKHLDHHLTQFGV